jgi:plastocyanin
MHSLALQLTPVLAAEKSKVPFYIAGGVLVVWALVLSLGIGLRRPEFPGSLAGQRAVVAVTAVLVLGAVSTAVLTAGTPAKSEPVSAGTKTEQQAPVPVVSAPVPVGAVSQSAATTGGPPPASSPAPGKAGSSLALTSDPTGLLAYNTKQLTAKAGTVTITMTNMSPLEHNVTIAQGSTILGSTPSFKGGSKALTLKLKPGTYTFYCSVPGHRQAGMEGTLSVS